MRLQDRKKPLMKRSLSIAIKGSLRSLTMKQPKPNPDESFESYYLRLITASFPDDIDKVRSAPDFKDSSMPVLIEALKQGVHSFTDEEKARIMGAGKS